MGKPSSSCLKIIACGSHSAVEDGTEAPEAKGSGEKRGWSFKKRSARHRVLSNSVTSENLTVENKEKPQSISIGSESSAAPAIPEKVLALEQPDEKCQPLASFELKPKPAEPELFETLDAPKQTESFELKPPKSNEPELSETLDAGKQQESFELKPLKSTEPELPETLDAGKQLESFELKPLKSTEPEPSETLDAPKQQESFEPEASERVEASEAPELVDLKTCASVGESVPLNLAEPEVSETVAASVLEPPESVEPQTCVPVGESESLNVVDPEVPETVSASALEPPEPVELKIFEGDVAPETHASTELKPSETVVSSQEDILDEPIVMQIQTGIRGFLAQRELVKLRSTVKLQAAIRGHLVRRQAVDTLHCMKGIVKVQNLIRARSSKLLGDGVSMTKCTTTKSSTEMLLRNAFVRQLLESTTKSKSTTIKCDPFKPNSAWTWLERWMDVSSCRFADSKTPEVMEEDGQSQAEKTSPIMEFEDLSKVKSETMDPESKVKSETMDPAFAVEKASKTFEIEIMEEDERSQAENITPIMEYDHLSKVKSESINPGIADDEASKTLEIEKSSISSQPSEESQPSLLLSSEEKMDKTYESTNAAFEESSDLAAQKNQSMLSDSDSQAQSGSLSDNLTVETKPKLSTKRMASEQVDVENKKFAYGSRKASNPAFIAAQSKFEVLSSAASSSASLTSPRQEAIAEYHPDTASSLEQSIEYHPNTASSLEESVHKEKVPSSSKAFILDETMVKMGGSECGTELSVSSTLDSPDHHEAEVAEMDLKVKYLEEGASNLISSENLEVKPNGHSSVYTSNSSSSALVQTEFSKSNVLPKPAVAADSYQPEQKPEALPSDEHDNGEYVILNMAADSTKVEQEPERSASDLQVEDGSQIEQPAYKVSPDATPNNSHITTAESQGTPSSQVSVKTKRSKVDKSGSNKKHNSHSSGKRTAVKSLHNSGVRGSGEQLSKDQKNGKRRNSFGSTKSDNIDQEPRGSTSSSIKVLPSYMQATQSAKAKAHSPRSSPDVHDKDSHIIKKRHSLPGTGAKQGSPRVQPPTSHSPQPQAIKGDANTPPQERRWVR